MSFEPNPEVLRGYFLVLHSRITPGGLGEPYGILGIKPGFARQTLDLLYNRSGSKMKKLFICSFIY